jgi:DNA-binding SARP family transcriptional activator
MIELRVLGTLDLQDPDNGDLGGVLARPKLVALLVYLVLARPNGFRSRETLLGLFWPESSQSRARRALNQSIYELRLALGEGVVVSRGAEDVGVDRARLWCDAEAFEAALVAGDRRAALELYGGDLLEGFALPGCEELGEWLDGRREGLRQAALRACLEYAEELAAAGEPGESAYWLRRALRWEPYDEDLARRLLEQLVAAGDRTGALREYEAFAARLEEELGIEPAPELAALAERARVNGNGPSGSPVPGPVGAPGVEGVPAPPGLVSMPGARGSPIEDAPPASPPAGHGSRVAMVMGILAMVAVVTVVSLFRQEAVPATPESRRVLVAGFTDRTGDPELADLGFMASEWIAQELSRTGLLRPILPPRGPLGSAAADPIAAAAGMGASLTLTGSYDLEGDSIVFQVAVVSVPEGEVVRGIGRVTGPRSEPTVVVERLRQRSTAVLAALVDERLRSWATSASSQPASYEAYRAFAEGMELRSRREYRAAAEAFHRAAAYDSTFTAPLLYAMLSHEAAIYHPDQARRDQRQAEQADSIGRYLEARRDRLPSWEAAWVDMEIAEREMDSPAWYAAMRRITDMTPEPQWLLRLAAVTRQVNRPVEALEILERLNPEEPGIPKWAETHLYMRLHLQHVLGNYEQELALLREYRRMTPEVLPDHHEIRVLAALNRKAELEREMRRLQRNALDPFEVLGPAMEAFIHGQPDVARQAWEWYLEQPVERDPEDPEELWRWGPAVALERLGRGEEARVHYERLLERASAGSDNVILFMGALGRIAADRGDRAEALRYDRRLASLDLEPFREPTLRRAIENERIQIAAALGDHRRAISMLETAIENGMPLYGNGDPEMFRLRWLDLRGNSRYEALVRPR